MEHGGGVRVRLGQVYSTDGWAAVGCLGAFWALFALPALAYTVPAFLAEPENSLADLLWHEDTAVGAWFVLLLTAVLPPTVYGMLRDQPHQSAEREVAVDREGLTVTRHRKGRLPARAWSVNWDRVRYVSARQAWFGESDRHGHKGRKHRVLRPALDIHLFADVAEEDRRVVAGKRPARSESGTSSRRVIIGGADQTSQEAVIRLAETLGAIRPDLFYRGLAEEQWYTPPGRASERSEPQWPEPGQSIPEPGAGPSAAGGGRTPPTTPVLIDQQWSWGLWSAVTGGLITATALSYLWWWSAPASQAMDTLAHIALLLTAMTLIVQLFYSPMQLAPRSIRVGPDGLEFTLRQRMWVWHRIEERIPWDRVQAVVVRSTAIGKRHDDDHRDLRHHPPGTGESGRVRTLEIYLAPQDLGTPNAWNRMGLLKDERTEPDSAALEALVAFPATRIRLLNHPGETVAAKLIWEDYDQGGPAPTEVPLAQLGRAIQLFRPDLCHGFDGLDRSSSTDAL